MRIGLLLLLIIKCTLYGLTHQSPNHGYIGIVVNDQLEITAFDPARNANEQGLQIGDLITQLNNVHVTNRNDCLSILSRTAKNDIITITILRKQVRVSIAFTLSERFDGNTHVDTRPLNELAERLRGIKSSKEK